MPRTVCYLSICFSLFLGTSCGDNDDWDGLPASVRSVVPAAASAMTVAAGLGGPLGPMVNKLQKDQASVTAAEAQKRVNAAYLGPVASPSSCVTRYWKDKGATFILEKCTLVQSGQSLNEVITVDVSIAPNARVTQTFGYLKVGSPNIYKGYVKVGAGVDGWSLVTADIAWPAKATDQTQVVLQGLKSTSSGKLVTLDGLGSAGKGSGTVFTANKLGWSKGDCLPSSGSLSYAEDKQTIAVAFSSTTPKTGAAAVTVGSAPAVTATILTPCVTP